MVNEFNEINELMRLMRFNDFNEKRHLILKGINFHSQ